MEYVKRGVEFAAALIIAIACLAGIYRALKVFIRNSPSTDEKSQILLNLGPRVGVALEFEIATISEGTELLPQLEVLKEDEGIPYPLWSYQGRGPLCVPAILR